VTILEAEKMLKGCKTSNDLKEVWTKKITVKLRNEEKLIKLKDQLKEKL
jgi:hypothetical protein